MVAMRSTYEVAALQVFIELRLDFSCFEVLICLFDREVVWPSTLHFDIRNMQLWLLAFPVNV